MIVHKLENKVIKARVISRSNDGETVLIPCIVFSPPMSHKPFILKRRQFPIKVTICGHITCNFACLFDDIDS